MLCKDDKENAVVILNKTEYVGKIMVILNDSTKFLKLGEINKLDHTSKIESNKLSSYYSKHLITREVNEQIRHIGSQRPKLYGLPNTHKYSIPLFCLWLSRHN